MEGEERERERDRCGRERDRGEGRERGCERVEREGKRDGVGVGREGR